MSIGSDGADMVIDDPAIEPIHLQIKCNGNEFTIINLHPQKNKVQLNGKPLRDEPLPLRSQNNVSVGESTIFFTKVDVKNAMPPTPLDDTANLEELEKPQTTLNAIWQSLNELIEQQGGAPSSSNNTPSADPSASSSSPPSTPPPLPKD